MNYKLRGRWPNGATKEHKAGLADLRVLAANWAKSGADCEISLGSTVISRTDSVPPVRS